jgi:hypothetical protein
MNEQLGLVNGIKEKRQTISMLEAELTTFTPMQEPEVILQEILQQEQVPETVPPAPAAQTETVGEQVSEQVPTTSD